MKKMHEDDGCQAETFAVSKATVIVYYKYSTGEGYLIREPQYGRI